MPIYIVETDGAGAPLDPVGGWHGPIQTTIPCDWIAEELDEDDEPIIVPEIEFPDCRHLRRPDWCKSAVRPPRAMPRGLRFSIDSEQGATGDEPPGVMETTLECWSSDPVGTDRNVADYNDNDGADVRTTWLLSTDVARHSTHYEPADYVDADFILRADARYVASDGTTWRLLEGPAGYSANFVLPATPVACLAIARAALGSPVNKQRSLVLRDRSGECFLPGRENLPYVWFPTGEDDETEWFNLPTTGTWCMEAIVATLGGPLNPATVIGVGDTRSAEDISTISWSFQPLPAIINEYQVFQAFVGNFKTGISAQVGDVLLMKRKQYGSNFESTVEWYINGDFVKSWTGAFRYSPCFMKGRYLRFFLSGTISKATFWHEP